jgi:hypothetical protein
MSRLTKRKLLAIYFSLLGAGAAAGATWLGYAISGLVI